MFPTRRITTSGGDVFRDEFSLAFDGSNDYVDLGSKALAGDDVSISAWIYLTTSQVAGILSYGDIIFRLNSSTNLRWFADKDGTSSSVTIDDALNRWTHIGVSSNDGVTSFYQDGVLKETETDTTFGNDSVASYIGRTGTDYFPGKISEIALYNKVLSASEIKTLYNGREPYNHKEGICSSNLKAWWRMGDGVLDSFPIIQDQVNRNIGSNLVSNPTFDTNTTGWEQYAGGSGDDNVISRETSIVHSGSGSLKIVYAAGNDGWGARLSGDAITGTANKLMLMEAYVYIPSGGYNGGSPIIVDGGSFASATNQVNTAADVSITDQWQYVRAVHRLDSDATGTIFLHTTGTDPSAGDILYWDDISVRMLDDDAGQMFNMTASDFEGDTP